ncbi:MAG: MarR family transcriptional regulator [Planctomycetota bacterium]
MAFLLRELPDRALLEEFAGEFTHLDVDATLAYLRLLRLGSEMLDGLDRFLAGEDMTHGRWLTLVVLHRSGGRLLPSELAEKQGVTRATMTGLLTKLVDRGLVERELDDRDGRREAAVLTATGRRFVRRVLPKVYRHINAELAPLSPKDRRALARVLNKLIDP